MPRTPFLGGTCQGRVVGRDEMAQLVGVWRHEPGATAIPRATPVPSAFGGAPGELPQQARGCRRQRPFARPNRTNLSFERDTRGRDDHQAPIGDLLFNGQSAEHAGPGSCCDGGFDGRRRRQLDKRRGFQPGSAEGALEHFPCARPRFTQYERCRGEVGGRQRAPSTRPWMRWRHYDHEVIARHDTGA